MYRSSAKRLSALIVSVSRLVLLLSSALSARSRARDRKKSQADGDLREGRISAPLRIT